MGQKMVSFQNLGLPWKSSVTWTSTSEAECGWAAVTADLIERSPPPGWVRDRAAEGRSRAAPVLKPRPTYCFTCSEERARPAATLMLAQKDSGTFFVSNIIPLSKHQLGRW